MHPLLSLKDNLLRLEKALGGKLFSEKEVALIKTFMDAAGSNRGAEVSSRFSGVSSLTIFTTRS